MKKLIKTLMLTTLIGLSSGCLQPGDVRFKEVPYEGYTAKICSTPGEFRVVLNSKELFGTHEVFVYAVDNEPDGRFDEIGIHAPIGHPIEKYMSLSKFNEIRDYLEKDRTFK